MIDPNPAPPAEPVRVQPSWEALARAAARRSPPAANPELLRELLVVYLAGAPYAIPVERVREIVRLRPVTHLPRVPPDIYGVISVRGEILQVLDLRRRLALPAAEPDHQARIVVLHGEEGQGSGVLVDSVREVLRVPEEALRPAASADSQALAVVCVGGEEFVFLLDLERVLDLGAAG